MTELPNSRLQRFAAWCIAKPISDFLATIKPSVTLAPVLSLLVAVVALIVTIYEIKESRRVRETQLSRWAMEGLAEARKMDSGKRATKKENRKDGKVRWKCSEGKEQFSARVGQISTLERLARIEPSLRDIIAHDVNLVIVRSRREIKKGLRGINCVFRRI